MKSSELISILLPIYHGEEYLPQAIQSIQAQSYPHFEVLAIIDGMNGTDGMDDSNAACKTILESFQTKDRRIRILELETNQGIEGAMNFGLEHAQGKYITRIDQDDLMHPERLAKQIEFFSQFSSQFATQFATQAAVQGTKEHNSPLFLGTDVALLGEPSQGQQHFIQWQNSQQSHQDMTTGLYKDSTLSHPSLFTETSTLRDLGGYQVAPWAEDLDLYFRAIQAGVTFAKITNGKEPLTLKRLSNHQMSRTSPKCKRPALMKAKAHYLKSDPAYQNKRSIYILGTGPTAIQILEGLELAGTFPKGFLEHKAELRKKEVRGLPVLPLQEVLETKNSETLILGAIGHQSTQVALQEQFRSWGLTTQEVLWMI